MPIVNEPRLLTFGSWIFRLRPSLEEPERLMVLLHGWTGDENSMWIFTRDLPREYTLLAPRAPTAVPEGGYSWREMGPAAWGFPSMRDLQPAVDSLLSFLDDWSTSMGKGLTTFDLMGFSQGAALACALALFHPDRVRGMAVLSGFLPLEAEKLLALRPLAGRRVFVSHGAQDDRIPVERARSAVKLLEASGAQVTYCESQTGHKVDRDCLKAMAAFFREHYYYGAMLVFLADFSAIFSLIPNPSPEGGGRVRARVKKDWSGGIDRLCAVRLGIDPYAGHRV